MVSLQTVNILCKMNFAQEDLKRLETLYHPEDMDEAHSYEENQDNDDAEVEMTQNPSRNAPCPCGSGKRYKHCCGKI